jgi:hypothetical protein
MRFKLVLQAASKDSHLQICNAAAGDHVHAWFVGLRCNGAGMRQWTAKLCGCLLLLSVLATAAQASSLHLRSVRCTLSVRHCSCVVVTQWQLKVAMHVRCVGNRVLPRLALLPSMSDAQLESWLPALVGHVSTIKAHQQQP